MKPVTSQRTRLPRINLCASGFLVPSGRAVSRPRCQAVTRGEAQPVARLFWMNYQRPTGNTGALTSLPLKVLSVENGKSPWTSICARCQKNAVLGKLYLFLKGCIAVLTLWGFLLFVCFLSPNACFPFFHPFSNVHVFIVFRVFTIVLREEKQHRGF